MSKTTMPELISEAQTTEEAFLRQIFVRDQMAEWSKTPLIMARSEDVYYWDVQGNRYLDALSGIYVASVGHNNRRVIDAIRAQLDTLTFSPPMHGTKPSSHASGRRRRACSTLLTRRRHHSSNCAS